MNELQISAHSMSALREHAIRTYEDRLVAQVSALVDVDQTAEAVRAECRELSASARAQGFTTEFEVAAYVTCGFAEGPGFDRIQPYRSVLESPGLSPRSRAEMLLLTLEHSGPDGGEGAFGGEGESGEEEE